MRYSFTKIFFCVIIGFSVFAFGQQKTKNYNYTDFSRVVVSSGMVLKVIQAKDYNIEVKADKDNFEDLEVEKNGNTLEFYYDRSFFSGSHSTVYITLRMPVLRNLELSGGSQADISMNIGSSKFNADLSGGSKLEGSLKCGKVMFECSGAGKVSLEGEGKELSVDGSGGSKFDLKNFSVTDVDAELSGGSRAVVNMNGTLNSDQSGGSKLVYYGKADLGNTDFSGGSSVSKGE